MWRVAQLVACRRRDWAILARDTGQGNGSKDRTRNSVAGRVDSWQCQVRPAHGAVHILRPGNAAIQAEIMHKHTGTNIASAMTRAAGIGCRTAGALISTDSHWSQPCNTS